MCSREHEMVFEWSSIAFLQFSAETWYCGEVDCFRTSRSSNYVRYIWFHESLLVVLITEVNYDCSCFPPFVYVMNALACWSSGMIRASGARGPGFDSRTGPVFKFSQNASFRSTFEIRKGVRSRGWFRSTDLWVMGPARLLCATLLKALWDFIHFC